MNTDLDLLSDDDLTALATAFEAQGISTFQVTHCEDGRWHAMFNAHADHDQPEPNIAAMLAVVESLSEPLRAVWSRCALREFNIGYDCGDKPWAFNQGLSSQLLGSMAVAGASLRITLYAPERKEDA